MTDVVRDLQVDFEDTNNELFYHWSSSSQNEETIVLDALMQVTSREVGLTYQVYSSYCTYVA